MGLSFPPEKPLLYALRPVINDGALTALDVTLTLPSLRGGTVDLTLPTSGMPDGQAPGYLQNLTVSSGTIETVSAKVRRVKHVRGRSLTVRYRLTSGYGGALQGQPFKPFIGPEWFVVHGSAAFVIPAGRPKSRTEIIWRDAPSGWLTASSAPFGTVDRLEDSLLFGGPGWRKVSRPIGAGTLDLYYREAGWQHDPAVAADDLAATLKANFDYWRDPPSSMTVSVIQVSGGDFGGRGLAGGFMLFADPDTDLRTLRRIVAHEHTHSWISRQIGGFPKVDDDLSAWLNEGFTEAVTARSLLRSGLWSLEDFQTDLNESLLRYGLSPAVSVSNRRIVEARFSDFDVGKIPYDRGRLLAILWDRKFRDATGGRLGLDAVLAEQRRVARRNDRKGNVQPANLLFPPMARQVTGLDLSADVRRFVDKGQRIELPSDLFGDCGRIVEVRQPAFERGFDLFGTLRNKGRIVGLVPGGPAERAGLREGDHIRISEVPSHDSQTPLTYRVVDDAKTVLRTVTYLPVGSGEVRFQRFVLTPNMSPTQRQACAAMLSGQS